MRISVDPVNNLMAVTSIAGLLIFNRTENGDVPPRYLIAGPKTGLGGEGSLTYTAALYPKTKKISISNTPHFGAPGTRLFTPAGGLQPTVGKILQTIGTSRQIQFSLKLVF